MSDRTKFIKEGYQPNVSLGVQPTKSTLNPAKPPKGGSGVPQKSGSGVPPKSSGSGSLGGSGQVKN